MLRLYHHLLLLHLLLLGCTAAALSLKLNHVVPSVKETQIRISDPPEIMTHHHHNGAKLRREGVVPQGEDKKGGGNIATAKPPEYSNGRPMFKYYSGTDHDDNSRRSEIGGEVIIGGLLTVALGAVCFYIRVTRRSTTTGILLDHH